MPYGTFSTRILAHCNRLSRFDIRQLTDVSCCNLQQYLSRKSHQTFAESGVNILEARCTVVHPMVKNRFVVEVGDTGALKSCIQRLRNVESVFDAYRVTPTG